MTNEEYWAQVKALRNEPMVLAWIDAYQLERNQGDKKASRLEDCYHCGFPHHGNLMCNNSQFGTAKIGGNSYSIKIMNLVYMHDFMKNIGKDWGFHWRSEIFFKRNGYSVEVRFIDQYNNSPQMRLWTIPLNEWASIVESVAVNTIEAKKP